VTRSCCFRHPSSNRRRWTPGPAPSGGHASRLPARIGGIRKPQRCGLGSSWRSVIRRRSGSGGDDSLCVPDSSGAREVECASGVGVFGRPVHGAGRRDVRRGRRRGRRRGQRRSRQRSLRRRRRRGLGRNPLARLRSDVSPRRSFGVRITATERHQTRITTTAATPGRSYRSTLWAHGTSSIMAPLIRNAQEAPSDHDPPALSSPAIDLRRRGHPSAPS